MSHFGLLEMSRQRIRASVLESSTEKCPYCGGSGHVRSVSSLALQVLRALEEQLMRSATHNLIARTRPDVALYVLNQKRAHLRALEERFAITITISADETVAAPQAFVIDRGEQVHTLEAARALAEQAQPIAAPAGRGGRPRRSRRGAKAKRLRSRLLQRRRTEQREGGPRRRRRRRGGRGRENGDRRRSAAARRAGRATKRSAQSEAEVFVETEGEMPAGEEILAGEPHAERQLHEREEREERGESQGERRRRRRGRRGGRRNRHEREHNGEAGHETHARVPQAAAARLRARRIRPAGRHRVRSQRGGRRPRRRAEASRTPRRAERSGA